MSKGECAYLSPKDYICVLNGERCGKRCIGQDNCEDYEGEE